MTLDQNFQVNLGGVIRLLSDHLYSGPEVYIRELLQNAVDAITARQHQQPTHEGTIRVELLGGGADRPATILVEDDGIGLTEAEVHQFLATIGQSSKSGDFSRADFIGQFGIGLLSGFLVSDEITVISQSMKGAETGEAERHPAVEWRGRADGTYSVRRLDSEFSVGTRVYLQAKPSKTEFFDCDQVEHLLRHFGHHLPHRILLSSDESTTEINEPSPWSENGDRARWRETCLEYGRNAFEIDFLDAIPIRSQAGDVSGVAFILPFAASPASRQSHRVYLKNMLLDESVAGLLPEWAFFVKCVINANQLRPNAARDAFHEDSVLREARTELGECLKRYLLGLAEHDRAKLDHLIHLHYMPIKALALEDDEFLRLFVDWLPFETTLGSTTLEEHCRTGARIRYVRGVEQFRQIASVASAQNICIFNGGYAYDRDLLERVAQEFPQRRVESVEVGDLVQNFEELTLEESEEVFDLINTANIVLQKHRCSVEARKFEPTDLPTLYTANESASFLRSVDQSKEETDDLWGGILDNVAAAAGANAFAQLVLNYRSPLVTRLSRLDDRQLTGRIIEILYVQSLLLGQYPLAAGERGILASGLLGLISHFIEEK